MARRKRSTGGAKKGAKKGARKGRRRSTSKAGKVARGASSKTIAAALNRIESRVDKLEHNDAATYTLLLGMANSSRKHHGHKPIKSLPGFVTPRLYRGGFGTGAATKALGSGKR